ncbi:hypothetical protein OM076_24345 [Solirubrobacter ginsenosidimutans]|uniref:DUF11 domain-containing protein n=1 Tax=Solirubrobacter ginsenosidimutans TaxID=490573 RepID=A0A9X3S4U7_9ACTN|nr:hypothetical protein [Solirubrobacter ginsenosidimutans]MDA0163426.1 hypothetical protein [Solirubrobacter ginsenosidimutans]
MMRTSLIAVVGLTAAAAPATAGAAELTPAGPATLLSQWTGPVTLEGRPPEVLVAARIEVGAGGSAGTVRVRARYRDANAVGDPVQIPAEPGTYTFPAPHIRWDYRGSQIGLDQETGGHAILQQSTCVPSAFPGGDPCENTRVNVFNPPGGEGAPSEVRKGAKLAMEGVYEPDLDQDLVGDTTEDRTDLRISSAPAREVDGRLRIEVTVTNAGPLSADRPVLTAPVLAGGRWEGSCTPIVGYPTCVTPALAAGETRVFVFRADAPEAVGATFTIASEGPDLVPLDNTSGAAFLAAPAFDLAAADRQRLGKGVKVQVRGVRAGRARVTVAFTVRGRAVKVARIVTLKPYTARPVTVRATGAKLRSLRRAAAKGPLSAEITVRTISGKTPVTAKTTVL